MMAGKTWSQKRVSRSGNSPCLSIQVLTEVDVLCVVAVRSDQVEGENRQGDRPGDCGGRSALCSASDGNESRSRPVARQYANATAAAAARRSKSHVTTHRGPANAYTAALAGRDQRIAADQDSEPTS